MALDVAEDLQDAWALGAGQLRELRIEGHAKQARRWHKKSTSARPGLSSLLSERRRPLSQSNQVDRRVVPSPRVSVCIPNFNYGRYVSAAIESCLVQSYPNVEVVVVDDGSTDNSRDLLSSYADVATVILQPHKGAWQTFGRAFEESTGDVVVFLDADDLLIPDVVDRAVQAFAEIPRASRVQWRLRIVDADGKPTGATFPPMRWAMPDGDLSKHVVERRTYVWPPTSGNAYPRWALELLLPLAAPATRWIDLFLADTTVLVGPVVSLSQPGACYRWHGANDSGSGDYVQVYRNYISDIVIGHENLRRVAEAEGIRGVPQAVTAAKDWAFASYRLASLKLDRPGHPIADDRIPIVAFRGVIAVISQPHFAWSARLKRAAWLVVLALTPSGLVVPFLERTVLRSSLRSPTRTEGEAPGGVA